MNEFNLIKYNLKHYTDKREIVLIIHKIVYNVIKL